MVSLVKENHDEIESNVIGEEMKTIHLGRAFMNALRPFVCLHHTFHQHSPFLYTTIQQLFPFRTIQGFRGGGTF